MTKKEMAIIVTEKKKFTHYKDKENAGNNKKEWGLG
jgi:hypothetical protein